MSDIVERLRKWCHAVNAASAQDLMDEAADEIERLRLTKKERKAIAFAAEHFGAFKSQAATLLGILERLK
jgi:ketosteroid isomerase-like protein